VGQRSGSSRDVAFANHARIIVALARLLDLAVEGAGLTVAQYRLLGFFARGPSTPSEIAHWLGVRKQSVTRQLDALVQEGLLARRVDEHDRRRVVHTVTPAGRRVLDGAEAAIEAYLEAVLATVSPTRAASVRRGLDTAGIAFTRAWDQARAEAGESPP
jgi:DNA-binding MarR family transcriptional regulator